MNYNIKLYKDTGLSNIIFPSSLDRLEKSEYLEIQPLNILQDKFLSEMVVKSQFEDIKNCDYCKIGDIYYFVRKILCISNNICKIFLEVDFSSFI